MMIRDGFVSNSSSSSFVIKKLHLTERQLQLIRDHADEAAQMVDFDRVGEPWSIDEDDFVIKGYVWMDNFDMQDYLDRIDVDKQHIHWEKN